MSEQVGSFRLYFPLVDERPLHSIVTAASEMFGRGLQPLEPGSATGLTVVRADEISAAARRSCDEYDMYGVLCKAIQTDVVDVSPATLQTSVSRVYVKPQPDSEPPALIIRLNNRRMLHAKRQAAQTIIADRLGREHTFRHMIFGMQIGTVLTQEMARTIHGAHIPRHFVSFSQLEIEPVQD